MRWIRSWPAALGLLLLLAAVVELIGNARTADRVPGPDAFERARRLVEAEHRPGDLVLVSPDWLGQGRVALGAWLTLDDQARGDCDDYPRIWELALAGHQDPDTVGLPVEQRWDIEGLQLTRYANTRHGTRLWRARDALAEAHAQVLLPEGPRPCPWDPREQHHSCGASFGEPWVWIGPVLIADYEQRARACLWAHPTERGAMEIAWDRVPSGSRLVLHTGLTYIAARDGDKLPVRVQVLLDDAPLGEALHPDLTGWLTFEYPIPEGPPERRVAFRISTDFQGMRHFCFDAVMRGAP